LARIATVTASRGIWIIFVADALAGTLAHHHRLLHEKWERLFDLTRRQKTGQ
jgi:hypothetical protein